MQQACIALTRSFTGKAIDTIASLPTEVLISTDYVTVRAHLDMLFGTITNDAVSVSSLFQRKQQPNESLRDFAQAIHLLSQTAYPDDASLATRHAISVFARGLQDQTIDKLLVVRSFPSVFASQRFAEEIEPNFLLTFVRQDLTLSL